MARKIPFQLYLAQEQHKRLKALSVFTRIPISELIRGAVDDLLLKSDEYMGVHAEGQSNEKLE